MLRSFLTGVLSFLLLFMQVEDVRHAVGHLGAQLQRVEHSALEAPTGDHCVECGLLASGTNWVPGATTASHVEASPWLAVLAPVAAHVAATPSYYQSRAPPSILRYA